MNMETGGELMRRATVEDLVAKRNNALNLYSNAHQALMASAAAVKLAGMALIDASPGTNAYTFSIKEREESFHNTPEIPSQEDYMKTARMMVDVNVWAYIIKLTDLETLMDKTAKQQFRQQLLTDPPEVTVDNVCATIQQFALDAGTIFKRGIAECFSKLDRRFRSHTTWKMGNRIILTHAFDERGWWNYHNDVRETLQDVERVFSILDGDKPGYCKINAALETARDGQWGARQTEVDSEFFKLRVYKNGNAHLWFKRRDLVDKANKLIGEYYGTPIPEDREAEDDGGLNDPKLTPAKNYGFFPTPEEAVWKLFDGVYLLNEADEEQVRVLEPSAGTGNLARYAIKKTCRSEVANHAQDRYRYDVAVDCVEIQPELADNLRAEGIYNNVINADFLLLDPATTGLYDKIIMNPPFDRERDIDHVMHALKFLKEDGSLHAIMSAGTEFRETRKSIAFREMVAKMGGRFNDLPPGSFSSVGTNCNTLILRIRKNGSRY